jgi:ribosomal protein RSM22 (predicted rRNA methylase)
MNGGRMFLEALAEEAARRVGPLKALKADLAALHEGFTSARGGRATDYLRSGRMRSAYLASFTVPNAARAWHVLERIGAGLGPGENALDAGAGTGAAALALAALSHPDSEIVLADHSAPALDLAVSLFGVLFPNGPRVTTTLTDVRGGLPPGRFKTVLAGHLLNELLPPRGRGLGEAFPLARTLADRTARPGALVFLEPAQRIPSRALSLLRDRLMASGFWPTFPCTHAAGCPVLSPRAKDWCVVDVPFDRPELIVEVDRLLGTKRQRLTVSALALSRTAEKISDRTVEVLSEPMRGEKEILLYLCGKSGRLVVRLPRAPREPLPRGSRLLLPENARPDGRDRTGAPSYRLRPEELVRVG